jgi:hypothetical protein
MSDESENKIGAWQPLTFKGVSRFARASLGRLFLAQLVVASTTAIVVVWFLAIGWMSVVDRAISQTKAGAAIERGRLVWPGGQAQRLAESSFIEFIVSPGGDQGIGQTADLQIELGAEELRIRSLFGYLALPYSTRFVSLGPEDVAASWGAWKHPLVATVGGFTVVWLLFVWFVLASIYSVPALLFGFYANRPTSFGERFKLSAAALLPAALLFDAALLLYAVGQLTLVGLAVANVLHIVVGWAYVIIAMLQLPTVAAATGNPFSKTTGAGGRRPK